MVLERISHSPPDKRTGGRTGAIVPACGACGDYYAQARESHSYGFSRTRRTADVQRMHARLLAVCRLLCSSIFALFYFRHAGILHTAENTYSKPNTRSNVAHGSDTYTVLVLYHAVSTINNWDYYRVFGHLSAFMPVRRSGSNRVLCVTERCALEDCVHE